MKLQNLLTELDLLDGKIEQTSPYRVSYEIVNSGMAYSCITPRMDELGFSTTDEALELANRMKQKTF